MTGVAETKAEVGQLLKQKLPKAEVARIDVREQPDAEGQPSFYIYVVFRSSPSRDELRQTNTLVDQLRTWLGQKGDERFPYFSFITEKDEKELSQ